MPMYLLLIMFFIVHFMVMTVGSYTHIYFTRRHKKVFRELHWAGSENCLLLFVELDMDFDFSRE